MDHPVAARAEKCQILNSRHFPLIGKLGHGPTGVAFDEILAVVHAVIETACRARKRAGTLDGFGLGSLMCSQVSLEGSMPSIANATLGELGRLLVVPFVDWNSIRTLIAGREAASPCSPTRRSSPAMTLGSRIPMNPREKLFFLQAMKVRKP